MDRPAAADPGPGLVPGLGQLVAAARLDRHAPRPSRSARSSSGMARSRQYAVGERDLGAGGLVYRRAHIAARSASGTCGRPARSRRSRSRPGSGSRTGPTRRSVAVGEARRQRPQVVVAGERRRPPSACACRPTPTTARRRAASCHSIGEVGRGRGGRRAVRRVGHRCTSRLSDDRSGRRLAGSRSRLRQSSNPVAPVRARPHAIASPLVRVNKRLSRRTNSALGRPFLATRGYPRG